MTSWKLALNVFHVREYQKKDLCSIPTSVEQSLDNNAPCALCTTKLSTLLSYLTGPTVGNVSDCRAYIAIYAASLSDQYGPTSPGTAKCLFGLDFSSHSSSMRRAILISLVSVFCFLALLLFFALWAYLRCKKRRGLLARGKETVLTSGLDSMNQSTTLIRYFILLKSADTRENVLEYLAKVININASRAHLQVDPITCASSGTFVTLNAVMLRLCEPFLDANLTKRDKIDTKYVHYSNRLKLSGWIAFHASSEEVIEWLDSKNPTTAGVTNQYNDDQKQLQQSQEASSSGSNNAGQLSNENSARGEKTKCEDALSTLKAMQERSPTRQVEMDIKRLEKEMETSSQDKLCYEAQILRDNTIIQNALSFFRLMIVWLIGLVGGFKMPLPPTCPMEFATMPEHFVEDAMELLIFASRIPKALDGVVLWFNATATLFEGHQLSLEYLVRNLLKLYVDIEFTGSQTQIAKEEEKGVYMNFLNFLINDSIYLLDESLNKILEIKELEAEMSNTAEWECRPVQEWEHQNSLVMIKG
ncbi:hypothetical protein Fmac_011937 [Flemingia macrophylla]|uniref:Ubiquitin conjugation factor E4 core domain-containing protein n=1 Tax=Flemingia macrophylla TaxID=520843 RepID=A0ABD1MNW1_9FABA